MSIDNMENGVEHRLYKVANFNLTNISQIHDAALVKFASKDASTKYSNLLKEEMAKHPTSLFFRSKAIEANVPNNNGDYFSEEELKKSAQTFVGVPFFTNHQNSDVEKAKGKIIQSEWNDEDKAIYVIAFVDGEAYPHLCRGIKEGYVNSVSMGCSVEYSLCSICHKKATNQDEYCSHIKNMKGRKFTGKAALADSGMMKEYKDAPIYEDNKGIRFIELSGVVDPACPSCHIETVYDTEEFLKAASMNSIEYKTAISQFNDLSTFANSEKFIKNASQNDVEQLNQALTILQDIAIKLIQNRKNIEMEFSADLVKILADLQEYVDNLVQAGFGKLPETGNAVPGAEQTPDLGMQDNANPQMGAAPAQNNMPISLDGGNVGETTGDPNQPLATPPDVSDLKESMRPSPSGVNKSTKLQRPVSPRKSNNGEDNMRRIPNVVSDQKQKITSTLTNDWQENLEKISNTLKNSLKEDFESNKTGGNIMSNKIVQEAKAKPATDEVLEKRLEEKIKLHPRTNKVENEVETGLLNSTHENKEIDTVEEKNLEECREDSVSDSVEEKNLESTRKGDVKPEILQQKLETQRVGKEPNSIIENLLSNPKVDTPSTRTASIKQHVDSALEIISKAVLYSQSTPERISKVASSFSVLSLKDQAALVESMKSSVIEDPSYEDFSKRASFWGTKGLQVTAASDKEIKTLIISLASIETKKNNLNPELVLKAFASIKNNPSSISIISNNVNKLIEAGFSVEETNDQEDMDNYLSTIASDKKVICEKCKCNPCECDCEKKMCKKCKCDPCKCSDEKEQVKAETKMLNETLKQSSAENSDIIIETSISEMGIPENMINDDHTVSMMTEAFARAACLKLGVKVAAVVNVTIDGESGDVVIAVDTQEGSVEIPVGGGEDAESPLTSELDSDEELPELNDLDNKGSTFGSPETTTPAPTNPATTSTVPTGTSSFTASNKKEKKYSQFGGGSPASPSTDPNAAQGTMDPTADMNNPAPGEGEGLQSFTGDPELEGDEGLPGDTEQKQLGSVCPFCGSSEVQTGRKDQVAGQFDCKNCDMKYTVHVNVEVLNPENFVKENSLENEDLENPESPSMPVAAESVIDRNSIKKISSTQKEVGHTCPGCGGHNVETKGVESDLTMDCKDCKTSSTKSVLINIDNPMESIVRVAWSLDPMKRKCLSCRKVAKQFASEIAFAKMIKNASTVKDFPEDKIRYWLETNYPDTQNVNNGPFKGQSFADTIVNQLKTFALTKVKYLKKLAETQAQEDPMDICLNDHQKKGYAFAESQKICNCLKEKFASEADTNIYLQAFAGMIDENILRKMSSYQSETFKTASIEAKSSINDEDSFDVLPSKPKTTKISSKDLAKSLKKEFEQVKLAVDQNKETEEKKLTEVQPKKEEEAETIENKLEQKQTTPQKEVGLEEKKVNEKSIEIVESIEEDADVPRGDATIGNEEKFDAESPDVPRGDAKMGEEQEIKEEELKVPSEEAGIQLKMRGIESGSSQKTDKIASIRREYAIKYAGQLLGKDIITEDQVDKIASDLALMPLDRMKEHIAMIIKSSMKKVASQVPMELKLSTPIVIESNTKFVDENEKTLSQKISEQFTIGNIKSDRAIRDDIKNK